jgi:hypothetical protein
MKLKIVAEELYQRLRLIVALFLVMALLQGCCMFGGVCKLPPASRNDQKASIQSNDLQQS